VFYNENFTFSLHNGKCVMLAMSLGAHCCVSLFDSKNWALSGRGSAISGLSASSRESRTHRKRLIALPTGRNSGGSTKHSILKNSLMCGTTTILRYAFSQNVRKLLQYFISPLGERARDLVNLIACALAIFRNGPSIQAFKIRLPGIEESQTEYQA
jgi:hypothetical protein